MLFGTLTASLLGNVLAGKRVVKDGYGVTQAVKER